MPMPLLPSALMLGEIILKEICLQVQPLCGKMKSNEENQTNHGSKIETEEGDSEEGRRTR